MSTNSSGGLSAQLLGESSYDNTGEGEDMATISFFLDMDIIRNINSKATALEEANSHLILLEVTGAYTWRIYVCCDIFIQKTIPH